MVCDGVTPRTSMVSQRRSCVVAASDARVFLTLLTSDRLRSCIRLHFAAFLQAAGRYSDQRSRSTSTTRAGTLGASCWFSDPDLFDHGAHSGRRTLTPSFRSWPSFAYVFSRAFGQLKRRNRIEIMLGRLKDWRRVATHYDRCPKVFLSAIALAATVLFCFENQ